jgi:hypothetical protein
VKLTNNDKTDAPLVDTIFKLFEYIKPLTFGWCRLNNFKLGNILFNPRNVLLFLRFLRSWSLDWLLPR